MKPLYSVLLLLCLSNGKLLSNAESSFDQDYSISRNEEIVTANEKTRHLTALVQHAVAQNRKTPDQPDLQLPFDLEYLKNVSVEDYLDSLDNVTSQCMRDLIYSIENIGTLWAIQMIDSYGKPGSGILQGNAHWLGDYDECLKVYAPPKKNSNKGDFHTQYCTVTWSLTVPIANKTSQLPISHGVCVPETCSVLQLEEYLEILLIISDLIPYLNQISSAANVTQVTCIPRSREFSNPAIGMMTLLAFFLLLAVLGSSVTIYEHCFNNSKLPYSRQQSLMNGVQRDVNIINVNEASGKSANGPSGDNFYDDVPLIKVPDEKSFLDPMKPFLKCFCIFTNGAKILNTEGSEGQLLCIHGIRFLSMTWVILGHTYAFSMSMLSNTAETLNLINDFAFQIVLQGFFSVDSFFVLSGFLLTYLFLKEMVRRDGKTSWVSFYIHRYVRLTPVYMIVLGFSASLTYYLGNGPFWTPFVVEPVCHTNWWHNLLYIGNFFNMADLCMGWSWYLDNDMQFYVISPLFLYTLWRWPKIGLSIISLLLCGCWLSNWFITYEYDLITGLNAVTTTTDTRDFMVRFVDYFSKIYVKPYTRIGPYLVGVIAAYILFKTKDKRSLKKHENLIGWLLATTLTLAVVYGLYNVNPALWLTSTYNAFSRTCFGIGLCWVIYVCLTGNAGLVNRILSFKPLIPLSRLTYCAYLVHPIIINAYYGSLRSPIHFTHPTMVLLFLGFLTTSYAFAFLTSLLFEAPLMGLEKLVMKAAKKT